MITKTVNEFLTNSLPNLKIAVIGDVMVDRYVFGDVSRISPEAPVPVNRVSSVKEVLGGAGNVASNLANLDCHVYLGAVAGVDDHGRVLDKLLIADGIDTSGLIYDNNRSTITKMRILGDRQQMMRLDFETITPITTDEEERLIFWLDGLCQQRLQGIVISDYGKGVCTPTLLQEVFRLAHTYNVQTIVDPKGADWSKYDGATCITPNVKELGESLGRLIPNEDASVIEAAKEVLGKLNIQYIIGTRSAKGITVVAKDGRTWHNPATQQDVFDVSGAGDTVVAMMISCLASGLSMRLALHIANGAAGIVVSKVGTYPIHRQELIDLWQSVRQLTASSPLYTKEEMKALIDKWQSMDETVVFTNGCFDILHRGHITYLQEAAQLGRHLIIGLNSDASVRRLKGEIRPIVSEDDRAALLSALQCVDGVVLFEEDTPAELLAYLRPNILVKGGDYKKEEIIGRESVDEVAVLSFKEGYSTSDIVKKIAIMSKEGKL
ncbi:bifunctional protein HldE [Veillonella tobetsuensis]|uniref:Bifunctional protein HldE n=1 Tax=Veillonella tobetsuensis TaxID=1110546 RepID=A0A480B879_9FIRM|nr:D-glycero-beta-D-manno-heptose 1-phosphate adenylyltransferase [Veillonella tobetsuensis]GCL68962.1 bifunctional protein HldE [Veillonella tobetsuensis]